MKNPVNIAKKGYNRILKIDDLSLQLTQLRDSQSILEEKLSQLTTSIEYLKQQNQDLINLISTESKKNELRFDASYKKPNESTRDMQLRFFKNLSYSNKALRTFQTGNVKLLKVLIDLCNKNHLDYFIQSGTMLGAVRHKGFVPWDDDTDIAMFRDDIIHLRKLLKNNKNYKLALGYDHFNKSRQLRFRTTNPNNPCFIDVYIYDYGNDASDKAWEIWHKTKRAIDNKFETEHPELAAKWREAFLAEENSAIGKQLKPLFEKYYDKLLNPNINKKNYTTVNWALDNFPVKWKRLFEKEMIFPTKQLAFEGIKVKAPNKYQEYLERQYGDIYQLPKDLVTHYKHVDETNINTETIEKFLNSPI